MTNYVLVHGAWEGKWAWELVAPKLLEAGHTVQAVDLAGSYGHERPMEDITLDSYVDTVIEAIDRVDGTVVLVGHSLGGAVISQVAERVPDRLERLVYVAAFLLENAGTPLAAMQSDEKGQLLPQLEFAEDESYAVVREETWRQVAFHDASEDAISAALPRLAERQSLQPFVTPLNLTASRFGSVPKTFFRTTLDRILTPSLQDRMIGNWSVETVRDLDAGHFPTLSMPDTLAELLLHSASVATADV